MAPQAPALLTKPFIDGSYVDVISKERQTLTSSVDGSVITKDFQFAGAADVDVAVKSAEAAYQKWKALTLTRRRDLMLAFADLVVERAEEIVYWETRLTGKPFAIAKYEAAACAEHFRFYAGMIEKFNGEAIPSDVDGYLRIVRLEPLGVCAGINAFNAPLGTFGMKCAPALASGNVIITKASEVNPFSTLAIAKVAVDAGIPPGVLNVLVGGAESGDALARHMKIRKISFTGSPAVGRKVQIAAAQSNLKRVTLELGGKSPFIVFDDADLQVAVQSAAGNSMLMNGQVCIMGSRMYVHKKIADAFIAGLKAAYEGAASSLGGDPFEPTTMTAPMFHQRQFNTVLEFLNKGKTEAQLVTGGEQTGKGCYIKPTIFLEPEDGADILQKEIFGPVVVIKTFTDEDAVIRSANDTEYGLASYIFTQSVDRAIRVSSQIEAGMVSVNSGFGIPDVKAPFGGYKGTLPVTDQP
ncbi:Aldehyde dehydrogenase-like protein 2 [Elsinoe fawcettii]|nr:Aldehyde dehydrogenase-like protein 2 [Elsinoe fawcettii]